MKWEEPKLDIVQHILSYVLKKKPKENIVIAAQSVKLLKHIKKRLEEWGYKSDIVTELFGETKVEARIQFCDDMNDGHKRIGLLSCSAGGAGINLQDVRNMLILTSHWNPS